MKVGSSDKALLFKALFYQWLFARRMPPSYPPLISSSVIVSPFCWFLCSHSALRSHSYSPSSVLAPPPLPYILTPSLLSLHSFTTCFLPPHSPPNSPFTHPRWSYDGKYFARKTENLLSIYELPVSLHLVFSSELTCYGSILLTGNIQREVQLPQLLYWDFEHKFWVVD